MENIATNKIILTGDRPTGPLHLGHYFGSLKTRLALAQNLQPNDHLFIMLADVQALTDNFENPDKVRANILEVAADNLALGLTGPQITLFIQSEIPAIAELTVFFSNLVTINRLKRNPTVKTEIEQKKHLFGEYQESLTYGFLGYPISQAADILTFKANIIPVGEDQLPMIEQTREIAVRFNRIYQSQVFPSPQAQLSSAPRIIGLDGNAKMSKSLDNAIYLKDSPEQILAKIKVAKTDSGSTLEYDPTNRPEISNLVLLYALSQNIEPMEAVKKLTRMKYGEFKTVLATSISDHLAKFRQKRAELIANPEKIMSLLKAGSKQALLVANKTMDEVRMAMKIDY